MKQMMKYFFGGLIAASLVFACDDDDDTNTLPPIDGYNNSDEVAAENLVAHWTFDDTQAERISGTEPSNEYGTVGFTEGQRGNALQLDQGVLVYPAIPAINEANALNDFTVSLWVNVSNNKREANAGFTSFFSLIPSGVTDIWGDIVAAAETAWYLPSSDSLALKGLLNTHPAEGGNSLQDNVATVNGDEGAHFMGAGEWAHYVLKWEASTSKFYLFANGQDVGGYTQRGDANDPGSVGPMIMAVPVQAVFGSLASSDIGFSGAPEQQSWNPWADASIDDVRVYNTTLSTAEINALYNLGIAGR